MKRREKEGVFEINSCKYECYTENEPRKGFWKTFFGGDRNALEVERKPSEIVQKIFFWAMDKE